MRSGRAGRRQFIAGLLATGLAPGATWADAGSPSYLSAAGHPGGSFSLCGIDINLNVLFQIPLPARGHAAAAHPSRPEAVAFARRPGTFAVVINCVTGQPKATLQAPAGRHFYGHGTYSLNGDWLFTTENDYEAGRGRVGVWDVRAGYRRAGEFSSGGIGPHDIKRLPNRETLVIANGGIDTHPETGRTKLNIPLMAPNLAYVQDTHLSEIVSLPKELHKNSIRHLAIAPSGEVAFGMQWQGDGEIDVLLGQHRQGGTIQMLKASLADIRAMQRYVASVAFSQDGQTIAATSPKGGMLQLYDAGTRQLRETSKHADVSGVAPYAQGFLTTSGDGTLEAFTSPQSRHKSGSALMWDNHLVELSQV